jgi:hypothetical protein
MSVSIGRPVSLLVVSFELGMWDVLPPGYEPGALPLRQSAVMID